MATLQIEYALTHDGSDEIEVPGDYCAADIEEIRIGQGNVYIRFNDGKIISHKLDVSAYDMSQEGDIEVTDL